LETQVLRQLCKQSCSIIATGGGCVTRMENYDLLHQNSLVIWIQRDPELLPSDGRPISQKIGPEALYKERKPLYEYFSDYIVSNQEDPAHTMYTILQLLK
jgi:shikimate dehydrogenase